MKNQILKLKILILKQILSKFDLEINLPNQKKKLIKSL